MNTENLPIWVAFIIQLWLGVAVFRANPKSSANGSFLLVTLCISAWLLSLQSAYNAYNAARAAFWIRNASASGILVVNAFNLLRLAIVSRHCAGRRIAQSAAILALPSIVAIGLCYTPLFLKSAGFKHGASEEDLVPQPVYGPLFALYVAFILVTAGAVIGCYFRDARRATGIQKVELQFGVAGAVALMLFTFVGLALQPVLPRAAAVRLAPFRFVVFSLIIAYGIATRKIMDVGFFLRRVASYAVLVAYLLVIYAVVWWLVFTVAYPAARSEARSIAHVAAAVVIAFAMGPARGVSQTLANRLFVGTRSLDFRATMNEAAAILRSVTTLEDLLRRFAETIKGAVGTDRLVILLRERDRYVQRYPVETTETSPRLSVSLASPLIEYLNQSREVLVRDELHRIRQTPVVESVIAEMALLNATVVIGIFAREHLAGVLLLGRRLSGRIYGSEEQNALQVLCGQLAVALENAELFTEVQNARIYNETLLQNLTTGVVAANADRRVTIFNKEAEQITGYRADSVIGQPLDNLPPQLREVLAHTLESGETQEHQEIALRAPSQNLTVRASSSIFHDRTGRMLGALMVVTDVTALKRLEAQIRRSDRLASLGTLSAGMAHEIKNPLVSIKTFAQLLPERYQDSDFRETFSSLIGHEIDRIDSLVNQLLRFARPAKPLLRPMHVHGVLEKSLQLVGHRLYQKQIKLTRHWHADVDTIRADADQLEQVFLNFFLNAMDAMEQGGELTVSTDIRGSDEWFDALGSTNGQGDVDEVLRITVRDNGVGIRAEDITHVFDPFFTTKAYGSGLGLSVVHGIVQEHGGHIEVESELSKGTAFHILLPLARFAELAPLA